MPTAINNYPCHLVMPRVSRHFVRHNGKSPAWLRFIAVACLIAINFSLMPAFAVNMWYDKPLALSAGDVLAIDNILPGATEADIAASVNGDDWALCWRSVGDSAMWRVRLLTTGRRDSDIYGARTTVEITCDGNLVATRDVSRYIDEGGYNSLGLVYFGGESAELRVGSLADASLSVPMAQGEVYVEAESKARCRHIVSICDYAPALRFSDFGDEQSLIAHLSVSDDLCEGVWRYLDRDIDTSKSTLGGKYTLATVRSGDGYDIVYVSGADNRQWQPMHVKGHMRRTIFAGVFEAEWVAADGNTLSTDVTAEISDDYAILSVHIPVLAATLRFSRVNLQP